MNRLHVGVAVLLAVSALPASVAPGSVKRPQPSRGRASCGSSAELPTAPPLYAFERNLGQAHPAWTHVAHGMGFTQLLAPRESVFLFAGGTLRLSFEGADEAADCASLAALPGRAHYLTPTTAARRAGGVPRFAEAWVEDLYPGVSLRWRDSGRGTPEYDLLVAPGADPARVVLRLDGGETRLTDDGALVTTTRSGAVRQSPPLAWQVEGGARVAVDARFDVRDDGTIGFALGEYDATLPLVIDPEFDFSTYFGGREADRVDSVAVGSDGSIYVLGTTWSPDLPTLPQASRDFTTSASDVFVAKLSPDASTLVWSVYVGGSRLEYPAALAVDAEGRVTAACRTQSADFPVANAAFATSSNGGVNDSRVDAAVFRLSPDGQSFEFSTYLGGTGEDVPAGVALLPSGDVVVGGMTDSTDFPTQAAMQPQHGGGQTDGFLARFGPTGALVFSTYLGGSGSEVPSCVAADIDGAVAVGGRTGGLFLAGTLTEGPLGGVDAFLALIAPDGASVTFSRVFGGRQFDSVAAVAFDGAGAICAVGGAGSADFPLTRPISTRMRTSGGISGGAWVGKFARDGSPQWVTLHDPGRRSFGATALAVDARDGVWALGTNARFTRNGLRSGLMGVRFSADGRRVTRMFRMREASTLLNVYGGASASGGSVLIVGDVGANLLPEPRGFQAAHAGKGDGFVTRLGRPSLSVRRAKVRLDFRQLVGDTARLSGTLDLASLPPEGTDVEVDFGGFTRSFRVDARGRGESEGSTLRLRGSRKRGSLGLRLTLVGDLAASLRDEGLTGDTNLVRVARDVALAFDDGEESASASVPLTYSARAGHSGRAVLRRR